MALRLMLRTCLDGTRLNWGGAIGFNSGLDVFAAGPIKWGYERWTITPPIPGAARGPRTSETVAHVQFGQTALPAALQLRG